MLKREIPHHAREGRVIRVSRSHIAPAPLTGELSPLQPFQPWNEHMQPLCYWHDEPVALLVENKPGDDWIDGRQWLGELPASWFGLLSKFGCVLDSAPESPKTSLEDSVSILSVPKCEKLFGLQLGINR